MALSQIRGAAVSSLSQEWVLSRCDVGLGRKQQLPLHVKIFEWQVLIGCQNLLPVDRQASLTHRIEMCLSFFGWEGKGAFGLEHAVLFFTRCLDPKPRGNQSEPGLNNKAEEIDFYIFPLSLFGAV